MEIEKVQNTSPSKKRNMDNIDEWIKKSKIIKDNAFQNHRNQPFTQVQECSYDASVLLHYNMDIVIGGYTGMFISVTERDIGKYRISINGSGSGAEDDTFVIINPENPKDTGIIKNGSVVCIRHKKFTRYLSYNGESRNVCLSAVVSGDHEKWLIYNDFVPNANESLESGGYVILRQVNGLYMLYGQDHGKEGIVQIGGNLNDTQLYDQQIWRILLSHSSFLELNPSSLYEEEILTSESSPVNLLSLPFQLQSSMITEECRLALFLSPGNLLSFHHYDQPLLPNKLLLLDEVIDYSQAEEYLKDGFAVNENYQMDSNLQNLLQVILPNLNQVLRIKRFILKYNRFEMGRIITAVIHLLNENMLTFDKVVSELPSSTSLSNLYLILLYWNNQLEVMDNLCRLCTIIRGGQLLNQIILLEENESNEHKKQFYQDILDKTSKEYFSMMEQYIYNGVVTDYYNEFMIIHKQDNTLTNQIIDEFELNPKNELSAISSSNAKILLSGHYINIVNNTGKPIENPVFKKWYFDYNVTVYTKYIDEAFEYANHILLDLLKSEDYTIVEIIHLMNDFFLLQRGELCIYLYDFLNETLKKPANQFDIVKIQSLFQQCLISVFTHPTPTTQRFIDSLTISKKTSIDNQIGWDCFGVNVTLDYPVNIIIPDSILLKYNRMFSQLLLYNRTCRNLDIAWLMCNCYKERIIQQKLVPTNMLLNNLKYFINTILFYLSTENIIPLASAFERVLPTYNTIDEFIKSFEDFIGTLFEKCFLVSDTLRNSLHRICIVCQHFVDFITVSLKIQKDDYRKKVDISETSVSEDTVERPITLIQKEVTVEHMKNMNHMMEILSKEDYQQKIVTLTKEFEVQRKEFLELLENQPGFLQSSFLGLHRKLKQQYMH